MENNIMIEIENKLSALPVLELRMKKLRLKALESKFRKNLVKLQSERMI